jgi:hypothetical protein
MTDEQWQVSGLLAIATGINVFFNEEARKKISSLRVDAFKGDTDIIVGYTIAALTLIALADSPLYQIALWLSVLAVMYTLFRHYDTITSTIGSLKI